MNCIFSERNQFSTTSPNLFFPTATLESFYINDNACTHLALDLTLGHHSINVCLFSSSTSPLLPFPSPERNITENTDDKYINKNISFKPIHKSQIHLQNSDVITKNISSNMFHHSSKYFTTSTRSISELWNGQNNTDQREESDGKLGKTIKWNISR